MCDPVKIGVLMEMYGRHAVRRVGLVLVLVIEVT